MPSTPANAFSLLKPSRLLQTLEIDGKNMKCIGEYRELNSDSVSFQFTALDIMYHF